MRIFLKFEGIDDLKSKKRDEETRNLILHQMKIKVNEALDNFMCGFVKKTYLDNAFDAQLETYMMVKIDV